MDKRLKLQAMLEELLGSRNVYYQPPATIKMTYPAIVYTKEGYNTKDANDSTYLKKKRYQLTVIDRRPDNPVIEKLMELPLCGYDRPFTSDNLYHDVLTIYY